LQPKRKLAVEKTRSLGEIENGSDTNLLSACFVRRKAVAKSKR